MSENISHDLPLPTSPEALMAKLEAMSIPYVLHKHEAVFTTEEAAHLKKDIPGVHVKNLFLKDKKDRMALVTLPGDIALDMKAAAPAIGLDRISFGSPDRLWANLGVRPGSVCPFAVMNDTEGKVAMILDEAAANADQVTAHPMLNTMSVTLKGADLVRFLESVGHAPKILRLADFARTDEAAAPLVASA